MIVTNRLAGAADYEVTATVPAPLPNGAPVFTNPPDGSTYYTSSVTVSGTCPVVSPAIIVVIYENNTTLGSKQCTPSGTFQLPVSLTVGTHTLIATVMNITGQTGASSTPLHVTYLIPTNPAAPTAPTSSQLPPLTQSPYTPTTRPLEIISESAFVVFGPAKDATWRGSIKGGTAPYTVKIWWGDGASQTVTFPSEDSRTLHHGYDTQQTYTVRIEARDANGQRTSRTITAVTPAIFSAYPTTTDTSPTDTLRIWLYGLYLSLVVVLLAFWRYEKLHHSGKFAYTTGHKTNRASADKRRKS